LTPSGSATYVGTGGNFDGDDTSIYSLYVDNGRTVRMNHLEIGEIKPITGVVPVGPRGFVKTSQQK